MCACDHAMMDVPPCALTADSRTVRSRLDSDFRRGPDVRTDAVFALSRTVRRGGGGGGACAGCREERADCGSSVDVVVPGVGAPRRRRRHCCTIWRKYVKFAAALCVVLATTVRSGGAAPLSRRSAEERMEGAQERPIWRQPCGMTLEANDGRSGTKDFDLGRAGKVLNAAQKAFDNATAYKDLLARHKTGQDYRLSIGSIGSMPSALTQDWCKLPKKGLGEERSLLQYYRDYAKDNLPALYKYLELVTGSLYTIRTTAGFSNKASSELQQRLSETVDLITSLLCEFDLLLLDRGIKKLPSVEPDQIPTHSSSETITNENDFLIFRDTLNFLDILSGVFGAMHELRE